MNYTEWEYYFQQNQSHFRDIDFAAPDELTAHEKSVIISSLQQFQRGENSEGKHLFAFARTNPDPAYLRCISLFIREEQSHARVLGAFMDRYHVKRIRAHWVDGVFRWLRKSAGLENTIRVLLTAEIISKVYYDALYSATGSLLLKQICTQIGKDEDQHIAFQCDTLNRYYVGKTTIGKFFVRGWHFLLLSGTVFVVWPYHRRVLRRGGYGFFRFFQSAMQVFFQSEEYIKGNDSVTIGDKKVASV